MNKVVENEYPFLQRNKWQRAFSLTHANIGSGKRSKDALPPPKKKEKQHQQRNENCKSDNFNFARRDLGQSILVTPNSLCRNEGLLLAPNVNYRGIRDETKQDKLN